MRKSWAKLNLKSKLNHHHQNLIQFEFNLHLQQINCRIHTEIEISNQWHWHAESKRNYGWIMVLFKKFALIKEAISKRNNLPDQNSDAVTLLWIAGTKILLFPSDFTSSSHNLLFLCNFLLPRESWRENELWWIWEMKSESECVNPKNECVNLKIVVRMIGESNSWICDWYFDWRSMIAIYRFSSLKFC